MLLAVVLALVFSATQGESVATIISTRVPIPSNGFVGSMTVGSDGYLYFVEAFGPRVGRLNLTPLVGLLASHNPQLNEWILPHAFSPQAILAGGDGEMYFFGRGMGKFPHTGAVSELLVLPSNSTLFSPCLGPDNNFWALLGVSSSTSTSYLARITTSGVLTRFSLPAGFIPRGNIAVGADGNLYFLALMGKVAQATTAGTISVFNVPTATSELLSIVARADGIWFIESDARKVAKLSYSTGSVTEIAVTGTPYSIIVGRDGSLYFLTDSVIGKIAPSSTTPTYFTPSSPPPFTSVLAAGPGTSVSYLDSSNINVMTPAGSFSQIARPAGVSGFIDEASLRSASDGNVYFSISENTILQLTPAGAPLNVFPVQVYEAPQDLVLGPQGRTCFTESNDKVGCVLPSGLVVEWQASLEDILPTAMAISGNGDIYFGAQTVGYLGFVNSTSLSYTEIQPSYQVAVVATDAHGVPYFVLPDRNQFGRLNNTITLALWTLPTASAVPAGLALDDQGGVWVTEQNANKIARLTIASGVIVEYTLPTANAQPTAICFHPQNKTVWFVESAANKIGRITAAGVIAEYSIPTSNSNSHANAITACGNYLFFTETSANKIGRVTLTGVVAEFSIPTANSQPQFITCGPDGNAWFTEKVGKITRMTSAGSFSEYALPSTLQSQNAQPLGITASSDGFLYFTFNFQSNTDSYKMYQISTAGVFANVVIGGVYGSSVAAGAVGVLFTGSLDGGLAVITLADSFAHYHCFNCYVMTASATAPDGRSIYFADAGSSQFGRILRVSTVAPLQFTDFVVAPNQYLSGLTVDSQGVLWVGAATTIIRFSIVNNVVSGLVQYQTGPAYSLTIGPDGCTYFAATQKSSIGRITLGGVVEIFPTPTPLTNIGVLTAAADGCVWFTETNFGQLGRIAPDGSITEIAVPAVDGSGQQQSAPYGIVSAADGSLYFADEGLPNGGSIDPAICRIPAPPAMPAAPVVLQVTPTSVRLSWTAPADNTGPITAYWLTLQQGVTVTQVFSASPATQATVFGLYPGVSSSIAVAAVNVAGTSLRSPSTAFLSPPCGVGTFSVPLGQYVPSVTSAVWPRCQACAAGSFSDQPNITECKICTIGAYCVANSTRATPCAPGSFQPAPGSASCLSCVPSTYCPSAGASSTTLCPAGRQCNAYSMTVPAPCPIGYFCPAGTSTPQPCTPGNACSQPNLTAQVPCAGGSFCAGGASPPQQCPAASYCPLGANAPIACTPGFWAPAGSAFQIPCATGTYCPANSAKQTNCPAGRFQGQVAQANCSDCVAGRYSPAAGQPQCLACPTGRFSALPRQTDCLPCPPGTQQNQLGRTGCDDCPAGRFTNSNATTECPVCSQGGVSADRTSCSKSDCPPGTEINSLQGLCQQCPVSKYSAVPGSPCLICPDGSFTPFNHSTHCISCDSAGLSCHLGQLTIAPGYFAFVDSNGSLTTAACPPSLCLGQTDGTSLTVCQDGRRQDPQNVLCGEVCRSCPASVIGIESQCQPGLYEWGGVCLECSSSALVGAAVLYIVGTWAFVVVLLTIADTSSASDVTSSFIYFAQTAYILAGPVSDWLNWLSVLQFQPQNASAGNLCLGRFDALQKVGFELLAPTLVFFELAASAAIRVAWRRTRGARTPTNFGPFYRTAIVLALFTYSSFAVTTVRFFDCVDAGGNQVNYWSPAIRCDTPQYRGYLALVLLYFLVDVVGFPLAIVFLFQVRYRELLRKRQGAQYQELKNRFGILFLPFSPDAQLWSVAILFRRLLCVFADSFLQAGPRNMAFALVHFVFLIMHQRLRPLVDSDTDRMEVGSLILLIILSILLTGFPVNYAEWEKVVVSLLIIAPMVTVLAAYAWRYTFRARAASSSHVRSQSAAKDETGEIEMSEASPSAKRATDTDV